MTVKIEDLPLWVWDLVSSLETAEDEHSTLFWQNFRGEWVKSQWCPGAALALVPEDMRKAARVLNTVNAKRTALTAEPPLKPEDCGVHP